MPRTIHDEDARETVTLEDVRAIRATEKALLCLIDGDEKWVPQSCIADASEVYEAGHVGELVVHAWWARKEGLGE